MQNIQGVLKPTLINVILGHNKHKMQPRHARQTTKHGAPLEAKTCPFQGHQGEGVALPFWRLQGTISTTEIPQDFSGGEAQAPKSRISHKIAQKRPFSRPKGGQTYSNHQTLLINNKEA